MNLNSNGYVLAFSIGMCVVVSAVLASIYTALKPTQDAAAEFDRQKNVMIAAGLCTPTDTRSRKELEELYAQRVREAIVDTETGKAVAADELTRLLEGKAGGTLAEQADRLNKAAKKVAVDAKKSLAEVRKAESRYRVAATTVQDGKVESYVLPISGKGLWSTLYGYLALEADKNTVRGITFYKHGETPGLGGEVENTEWTAQWHGKTIRDEAGKLTSVTVKKGKVDPAVAREKAHYVDGLSGATITSNGVTKFVAADLAAFSGYLSNN